MLNFVRYCKHNLHDILRAMAPTGFEGQESDHGLFAQSTFAIVRSNGIDDVAAQKVGLPTQSSPDELTPG